MTNLKRIGYSVGDPAGIGADILLSLAQKPFHHQMVVFGCPESLSLRASELGLSIQLERIDYQQPAVANGQGLLHVHPCTVPNPDCAGKPSLENRQAIIQSLEALFDTCLNGDISAMVTGPVSKYHLHTPEQPFAGHTEFFANRAGVNEIMMAFYHPKCLVGLVTTHIPITQVSENITSERIKTCVEKLQTSLALNFGIHNPRIGVLGLNPHAGENGQIGGEDKEIILPTINKLNDSGFHLEGPLAGDTAFLPQNLDKYDGLLAMYHDQGLGPLKALGFGGLVNVTLGLPMIRTSVDHGTAFDIAGLGKADASGLEAAIALAIKLSNKSNSGLVQ